MRTGLAKMVKSCVISPSIRLLALDIDGTLLNSQFQISDVNLSALRARTMRASKLHW